MSTDDTKRHSSAFETDSAVAEFAALLERHSNTLAALPTSSDSNVDGTEILFSLERIQRFELLLHLVANLQQPLVLCGPAGIGKTTFLGLLIDKAFDNWQVVSIPAGNGLSYSEAIAHIAEQLALPHASEHAVVEALQQRARAEGLLVLLLDNADKLEPGVITSLWQLARHHPALRPVLALRPEEVQRKTISDGIALGDCHFVDIPALDEAGCEAFLQRLAARPPRLLAVEEINSARVRSLLQASQGVPGQIVALLSPAKSSARRASSNYIGLTLAVLAALGLAAVFGWRWYVPPGQASAIWKTAQSKLHLGVPQPNPIPEGEAANVALSERPSITAAPEETAQPEAPAPAPPVQQTQPLAIEIAPASQPTPVPPPQLPQEETRAPLPVVQEPAPTPEPAPAAITPAPRSTEPAAIPPIAASAPAVVPVPPAEPIPASPPTPEPAAVAAKKTELPAPPASERPAEPVVAKPAPVKTPAAPPKEKEKEKAPAIAAPSKSAGKAAPSPAAPAVKPPPAAVPAADISGIPAIQDAGWLMAQPAQSYTLLIMSAREPASVKTLLARYPAMKGRLAAYKKSGNALYHVYYGLFASEAEALQATAQLPPSLGKPVPRSLKAVQQDLRAKP